MAQARALPKGLLPGINPGGSAIGAGLAVIKSTATVDAVALPAASTDPIWGVTTEEIPALSEAAGTVQTQGRAVAIAGASFARGVEVEATTAGKFITRTTGRAVGIANTAGVLNQEFELDLYGPGGLPA